tara:strand:- start:138 stop:443 length:306 start_codon:yes stop_codon:yes gene_type:complete
MSAHTPGPWSVVDGYYPGFKEITGPSFKLSVVMLAIDLTEDSYQKRTADLNLIAAAPENYASNKELASIVRELCRAYSHPLPEASLDRSDAAIAKAEGEQK